MLSAHGVYAQTVTTALTAQNTLGVSDIHIIPPSFLEKQIDACLSDIGCDVVKIGMLASADTVRSVARKLREWRDQGQVGAGRIVLDPVMVSTSGSQLLPEDAIVNVLQELVPLAEIVTPNVPEAMLMLKRAKGEDMKPPESLDELKQLAVKLFDLLKPRAVLLKGGHVPFSRRNGQLVKADGEGEVVTDVIYAGHDFDVIESRYQVSRNTHGTGCSLASSIAANLALGNKLNVAVRRACEYVAEGIATSINMSKGSGPINHFHNVQILPFTKGRFLEYLLNRSDVEPVWQRYVYHPFADQMGSGALDIEVFKEYLIQDYLYLVHFARTNALSAYKSTEMAGIMASAQIVTHIEREMQLHLEYCKEFGLSKDDIVKHKESLACVAYSRYVLDVGQSQDWMALQISLASCLLGYGIAATHLQKKYYNQREGNRYWKWVENYVAEDYRTAVQVGSSRFNERSSTLLTCSRTH